MSIKKPYYILRPVNPFFIGLTLSGALFLNIFPWGNLPFVPDFLALVLIFWNVHEPRIINVGTAFVMGLLMDVHNASVFGQNALVYTLLSYLAIMIHRRILWFSPIIQVLHLLPLLLLMQCITLLVSFVIEGGYFSGWRYFTHALSGGLLWPWLTQLLLAPQRRPVSPDENRPL